MPVYTKTNNALCSGFTLLELMITVVILSILAAIAYPSYMGQIQKTRRVDGKSAVLEIAMAEEQYYTMKKNYTADFNLLSIDSALKNKKSKEGYYTLTLAATKTTFKITAKATGAQAKDTDCATMAMDQMGVRTSSSNTTGCW